MSEDVSPTVHLQKIAFGIATVSALRKRVASRVAGKGGRHVILTRMTPKRAEELVAGGSLYWVIGGALRARQRIVSVETFSGSKRCRITLDPTVHETDPVARKPFQGWRYLKREDAPTDLERRERRHDIDPELERELAALGLL